MSATRLADVLGWQVADAWTAVEATLQDLGDDEYLWEPAPGCWSIRRRADATATAVWGKGEWVVETATEGDGPAPITSIAWHLLHAYECLRDHARRAFGAGQQDRNLIEVPSHGHEAVALLSGEVERIRAVLADLDDAALTRPAVDHPGPAWEALSVGLHDLIHHGAEIGTLRDLRKATEGAPGAQFHGQAAEGWYVELRADLVGDVEHGVVTAQAHPAEDPPRGPLVDRVGLSGALLREVDLRRARVVDSVLDDLDIWVWGRDLSPSVDGLRINGVEIAPLVAAELDRRSPERRHLRGVEDLAGLRSAWPHVERMWVPTVERARRLPEDALRERVNGEFSFLETLRHLVFCIDAWVRRAVLGEESPYHAIAKAYPDDSGTWSPTGKVPWSTVGIDVGADPTLDEVLEARSGNFALVRDLIARLDDQAFAATPPPRSAPGYPPAEYVRSVGGCLIGMLNEEWWHHQYALRDLAVIEAQASSSTDGGAFS